MKNSLRISVFTTMLLVLSANVYADLVLPYVKVEATWNGPPILSRIMAFFTVLILVIGLIGIVLTLWRFVQDEKSLSQEFSAGTERESPDYVLANKALNKSMFFGVLKFLILIMISWLLDFGQVFLK